MTHIDPFSDDYDPSTSPVEKTITMCSECKRVIFGPLMLKIMELLEGRQIICIIMHGSKLYGLDHKDSDTDIKGVFLPSKRDMLLGKIPNVISYTSGSKDLKNSKDDVDIEMWSIHHFFANAMKGDTGAISMLNAPFEMICSQRPMWMEIVDNADMFYSKNMKGLIGFVRTQANKYSIKGAMLNTAKEAKVILESLNEHTQLRDVWDTLPEGEYATKIELNNQFFWEVCGRKIQNTSSAPYALGVINSILKSYGKRAKQAGADGGLDWKAISHSFRVASELSDLFEFGMIKYPLKDSAQIKRIKMGELDFKTEVLPDLNSLMDRVHKMSIASSFPDEIDSAKVNDFLYELLKKQ